MKIEINKNAINSEIETLGAYVNTLSKDGVTYFSQKLLLMKTEKIS